MSHKLNKRMNSPKRRRKLTVMGNVFFCMVALIGIGVSMLSYNAYAKYIKEENTDTIVKAQEFYFTSDYLSKDTSEFVFKSGTTSFAFELRNYDGLNQSELDIQYSVTVEPTATINITDSNSDSKLNAGDKDSVTVTLTDLTPGIEYTVKATGTNGYHAELSAKVTVGVDNQNVYKNTRKENDYVILTVWTGNVSKTVSIVVPEGLVPDWTDKELENLSLTAKQEFTLTLDEYESRSYRFFTTKNYKNEDITVKVNGNPIEDETPLN